MFESCAGGVASNCCIGGGRCRNGLPNAVHRQRIPNGDCSRSSCPCPQSRRRISWQTGPDNDVDVLGEWRSRIFFFLSMFTFFCFLFPKIFPFWMNAAFGHIATVSLLFLPFFSDTRYNGSVLFFLFKFLFSLSRKCMIQSCVCTSEGFAKGMLQPKEFTTVNRASLYSVSRPLPHPI